MAGQFIVTRNGRETFLSEEELRRTAARGQLSQGDLVYHPVLGRWLYAREVEEVRPEMAQATALGRPVSPLPAETPNGEAIAGFVLGVLGHVPLIGFLCCLCGIYFSSRGLKRAALMENRGHGLAVAGVVLSIVFLGPGTPWGAVALSGF